MNKLLFTDEVALHQLHLAAQQIKHHLDEHTKQTAAPFVLWLMGDLGAGKTTFTRTLLQSMGLDEEVPIASPTFTYINEYLIAGKWYAHMDFYRATSGFDPDDLGLIDHRDFSGFLVEWPSRLAVGSSFLAPTHLLTLQPCPAKDFSRQLTLHLA